MAYQRRSRNDLPIDQQRDLGVRLHDPVSLSSVVEATGAKTYPKLAYKASLSLNGIGHLNERLYCWAGVARCHISEIDALLHVKDSKLGYLWRGGHCGVARLTSLVPQNLSWAKANSRQEL